MELKQFVSESLSQIIEGIKTAQANSLDSRKEGSYINPEIRGANDPRIIEFDIAVSVTKDDSVTGGAGIFIGPVTLGTKAEAQASNSSISRIKFSVPTRFPVAPIPYDPPTTTL